MAITPEDLHRYAMSILLGRRDVPNPEVLHRTNINRTYYAALIRARNFVFLSHESQGIHSKVKKNLFNYKGSAGEMLIARTIAEELNFMCELRGTADYRLETDISFDDALDCAVKSLETLRLLEQLEERRDEALSEILPLVFSKSAGIIRFSVHGQATASSRLARFCPRKVAEPVTDSAD